MYEAQQAHYFGLPPHLALASVTSQAAAAAGLDHRIGVLYEGSDADVVLWDSHPLRLSSTPMKVWIDGILQIPVPADSDGEGEVIVGSGKDGKEWQELPDVPNWDKEREQAIKWEGLPPLQGKKESGRVAFTNVRNVWTRGVSGEIEELFAGPGDTTGTVVVENGKVICLGSSACSAYGGQLLDLHGGSISPGLMTFGSPLGLEEIESEPSTANGNLYDAFRHDVPAILNDIGGLSMAVDALLFQTRNALYVSSLIRICNKTVEENQDCLELWGHLCDIFFVPIVSDSGISCSLRSVGDFSDWFSARDGTRSHSPRHSIATCRDRTHTTS